ncbi:hypothetical protein [Frigoribacterium sp. VKM Ac-2530]|uniref:hypothetical protein n=1 Tax=Frigoribacterium sp. VKM Ac-2530 TaxID=2783822 RepID=UPI00188AF32D|nr:hypothetical protein [Frigoribacterium sp. VKM Ac-2530]MBF4578039.1 hypothetical protein [Frigoribacterium sp. VKM Ac-2530]
MTDTRPGSRPDSRPDDQVTERLDGWPDAQVTERLDSWPDAQVTERLDGRPDAHVTERLDGWPDGQVTERLDGWPDGQVTEPLPGRTGPRPTDRLDAWREARVRDRLTGRPDHDPTGRSAAPTRVVPATSAAPTVLEATAAAPTAVVPPAAPPAVAPPAAAVPPAAVPTASVPPASVPAAVAPSSSASTSPAATAPAPLTAPRPAGTLPRARAVEAIPAGDLVLSLVGVGPIPARHVATAPRLHDERLRADLPEGVDDHTPLEAAFRLRTEVAAERWLARRTRQVLDPAARRLTAHSSRHREVLRRLDRSGDEPLLDTTGRTVTRDEARATADRLSVAIEASLDSGSEKHRTESRARKLLLLFFVLADFALFAYFMSRVLNVDVFMPATDPIAFTTSIVFALLFTLGVAYALHHFGHAHRVHKDDSGEVVVPDGAVQLRLQLVYVHVLTVLPGVLIGVRIVDDALVSGAPLPLALLLGVAIGVVMAGIGHLIYRTELRDGTSATDRLLHLGRHLRKAHRRDRKLHLELDRLERRIAVVSARAERAAARIEQTGDRRANRGPSTRTLRYTRSLAGTVHVGAALPVVRPARGGLDEALGQIRAPRVTDLAD